MNRVIVANLRNLGNAYFHYNRGWRKKKIDLSKETML
ncbi:hypothetical protein EDD70_0130 [Hydrogenoanaerobacterium saccharovorans]|uniref:Uncharacterized protein n=1 Tax=Hydrogenoanaerobacterium saccharovorans TaxID=474960 RepID=A0A1H8BKK3_9FIRM|nr:hypothetical protein EDD70_0130 [Hydrogenoanaerobacterium saccharovorans]SEM83420.1 hypothetical protein SAMN05216180_1964 [Hydrogenoanaerobacterium saccharovorans]